MANIKSWIYCFFSVLVSPLWYWFGAKNLFINLHPIYHSIWPGIGNRCCPCRGCSVILPGMLSEHILLGILFLIYVIILFTLIDFQLRSIWRNQTGIEDWIMEKAAYRLKNTDRKFENPYQKVRFRLQFHYFIDNS